MRTAPVFGLDDFGLTLPELVKLGATKIELRADLRELRHAPLFRFAPAERAARLLAWYERKAAEAMRTFPAFSILWTSAHPYAIAGTLPASSIPRLLRIAAIERVWIDKIPGRRKRKPKPRLRWFTVHARVAIQIEGQTRGSQTYEDRFVAVKATSVKDAERRLRPEFRAYAAPYLNSDGEMVRWALEEIVDVYDTGETELDGVCVEVYSILKRRRMRPERVWKGQRRSR